MAAPKILLWDLETGYNIATIFSLFSKYTPFEAIQQERYIICGAYTELDSGNIKCVSQLGDLDRFREDPSDDYYVVKRLHKVLSEADALIAHYGDNFDMKFFNTRSVFHGFGPLPPITQIDTQKIAKAKFLFNCNKLDYIAQYLGVGEKIRTSHELWLGCLQGKQSAVKEMVRYNKQDVAILEKVYKKISPYSNTKLNKAAFVSGLLCPLCGSRNLQQRGSRKTVTSSYLRYQCRDCGKWSHLTNSEKGQRAELK